MPKMSSDIKNLSSLIANKLVKDKDFKIAVSSETVKIILSKKSTIKSFFDPSNLMNFMTGNNDTKEIVGKVLSRSNDNIGLNPKKEREQKLKEKKTHSAFYSKVPPRVEVPLKRGDSVTDIVSKLYTLLDKSFIRKIKEEKEKKKLEKGEQKKRETYNKSLIKMLSGFGKNKGKYKRKKSKFPWGLLVALSAGAFIANADEEKIKKGIENAVQGSTPFVLGRVGKGILSRMKKTPKKPTTPPKPAEKPNVPSVEEKPKAPDVEEKPKSTEKKLPKKPKTASAEKLKERSEARRTSTKAPPEPTIKPNVEPVTATKVGGIVDKSKKVLGVLKKLGKIAKLLPGGGARLLSLLPVIDTAESMEKHISEYNSSPEHDEELLKKNLSGDISYLLGGIIGMKGGEKLGQLIGSMFPGPTKYLAKPFLTVLGGILGSYSGSVGLKNFDEWIYNDFDKITNFLGYEIPDIPDDVIQKIAALEQKAEDFDKEHGGYIGKTFETIDQIESAIEKPIEEAAKGLLHPIDTAKSVMSGAEAYGKELSQGLQSLTQKASSIFQGTAKYATIIADQINTGDALTSLQQKNEEINLDYSAQSIMRVPSVNNIGIKGSSKSQDYGETHATNKSMDSYNKSWRESLQQ